MKSSSVGIQINFRGSALTMESNGLPFSLSFVFSSDQWPAGAKNVSDNGNRFIHAKVGRPVIIQLCAWS